MDPPFVYRFLVATGVGTGVFLDAQTVFPQIDAIAVVAGDWDGDGDLDLAVANFGADQVSILMNDGTGNFSVSSTIALQVGATALVAGDWDGDGDLDLAVANFGANNVTILKNDGTGVFTFTVADRITAGVLGPKALAAGDWDGDGDLDLAVANFSSNSVTILKNDGTGVFTFFRTLSGFDGVSALASGDWDDDGDLDLAVANFGSNTVAILENDGTGVFSTGSTVSGMVGARALIAGDWDNDGDLDLAVGNSGANTVVILKNDGSGTLTSRRRAPSPARRTSERLLQGTGMATATATWTWRWPDFSSNNVTILRNNGSGSFSFLSAIGAQLGVSALAAGDWDGNGSLGPGGRRQRIRQCPYPGQSALKTGRRGLRVACVQALAESFLGPSIPIFLTFVYRVLKNLCPLPVVPG